ncbi:MAG: FAD-dependent oxidoreductase [Dehalococcoidales bacterium]|nr:FAD-dependent oxidoreductase [Dehalococcoidales bacterium]
MTSFNEYLEKEGHAPEWPYRLGYDKEEEIDIDVLVIGGGIAGCWAAISAARTGLKVALVEKSATVRSGAGGPGCDHWCDAPANPVSKVDPDQWALRLAEGPYSCGIGYQIQCRENYDTLLELEKMGAKIRDTEGKYRDEQGFDEKTKFLISPRYNPFHDTNVVIRIWGTTFKPVLKKECQRLGVQIFDRVMATSLLTARGIQGSRVVGATGVNSRTGEFLVFKAVATILAAAGTGPVWLINTELAGYSNMLSRAITGDGIAMAWKAGAELTLMERSGVLRIATGYKHKWYTGAGDASYENVPLVDSNGKSLPVVSEPGWNQTMERMDRSGFGGPWARIREGVLKGDYELPFYGDFPAMNPAERNVTWNMLLGEESTTKIIIDTFGQSGFDPSGDLLQNYQLLEGSSPAQWREASGGGLTIDWNLKTSLDGLYAAGTQIFSARDHSFAAATGRYAGRKAAAYARQISQPVISPDQVEDEKKRVYAPLKANEGIDWKELHAGIARAMQYYCSEYKTERLFNLGLNSLKYIEEKWVPRLHALDPHKLVRSLEDLSLLTCARIILHASLARKASSRILDFNRIDYPRLDPPEWNKFITLKQEDGKVSVGEKPFGYYGNMKENYESHNRDYTGVYVEK